jgi:hypothetical protein
MKAHTACHYRLRSAFSTDLISRSLRSDTRVIPFCTRVAVFRRYFQPDAYLQISTAVAAAAAIAAAAAAAAAAERPAVAALHKTLAFRRLTRKSGRAAFLVFATRPGGIRVVGGEIRLSILGAFER